MSAAQHPAFRGGLRPLPTAVGRRGPDEHPAGAVTPAHLVQLLFLGAVWGGAFLFLRVAGPEVGPVWAAEIRIAIGAAILLAIAGRRTWRIARTDIVTFAIVGATFSAIPFTLIAFAELTLPAGYAAVLNASTPLFTAALGVVWLGERLSTRLVMGLATGVAAVVLLVGLSPLAPGPTTVIAAMAMLGSATSYAVAGTFVRRRLPGIGGVEIATGQLTAGAVLLLPFALASGSPGTPSFGGIVALVALGVLSTAIPWPLYFRLLSQTTPTIASVVTFVVPAFAAAWGAIVLGEAIGGGLVVGFGFVLLSLALVTGIRLPLEMPSAVPAILRRWVPGFGASGG